MVKVLVTGCAGLLGANFTKYLCDKNHDVVGVDNLSGGYREYVDERATFIPLDLIMSNGVQALFDIERPDYVYHFAAYAACGLSPFVRNFNYQNNAIATANLINQSINFDTKAFVFASSMTVYGDQDPPFTEDMPYKPSDPYAIAKMAMELDLKDAHERHGLDYVVVRPHNVHGIYQNIWDKYRNVIGIFIRKAINNEPLLIYGDGNQVRAFSDVDYYMKPLERLMAHTPHRIYNIGADETTTIRELAEVVQDVAYRLEDKKIDVQFAEPRNETRFAYCDHSRAKHDLGFIDHTDLHNLVEKMYHWALNEPNREVKDMKIEVPKGLYTYWK